MNIALIFRDVDAKVAHKSMFVFVDSFLLIFDDSRYLVFNIIIIK